MTVRGEFSIAVAILAIGAGVEPLLGPLAVAYVMAVAFLGPLLTQAIDPVTVWVLGRRAEREADAN